MPFHIAIVGMGPTGLYTLQNLVQHGEPLEISIFESGGQAGVGMPYSIASCRKSMLANIASIEIPSLSETYLDWMRTLPLAVLESFGVDADTLDERVFTPRLLLGQYFRAQFVTLLAGAEAAGHRIHIHEECEIADLHPEGDKIALSTRVARLEPVFDQVVLTTGHVWPDDKDGPESYFASPWSGLFDTDIPAVRIGIMGTSLSSIDAAMAIATQHGVFRDEADGRLVYALGDAGSALDITLMSRNGLLPEADFYCGIPYKPLTVMTDNALAEAVTAGQDGLLDRVFGLFLRELQSVDQAWVTGHDLDGSNADTFTELYFDQRRRVDPFEWARSNLTEAESNKTSRHTVGWRYAILRMHQKIGDLVTELSEDDHRRFDSGLKRVFIDNYAAVPSQSIRRMLALHDAGVLSLLTLGQDYITDVSEYGTVVRIGTEEHRFALFVDARGQKALESADLPFPSLRHAVLEAGQDIPVVGDNYEMPSLPGYGGKVVLGSLPYLMHERPFIQGITESAEIGSAISEGVLARIRANPAIGIAAE